MNRNQYLFRAAAALGVGLLLSASAAAAELYVGPDAQYQTIQAAIDAAGANDVIHVAEGVYSTGGDTVWRDNPTRVKIESKNGLRIVGAGRGKTIIRGTRPEGLGDVQSAEAKSSSGSPYRCVHVANSTGVLLQDLTLECGETGNNYSGGGICLKDATACLVDCEIRNCAAGFGGGAAGGSGGITLVRTLVTDTLATKDGGAVTGGVALVNCVFARTATTGTGAAVSGSTLYNCTMADNKAPTALGSASRAYNSLIVLSSSALDASELSGDSTASASVLGSMAVGGHFQVAAPTLGDFRPLAGSPAVTAGLAANLEGITLPTGVSALFDVYGRPIVADGEGRVMAGAVQGMMTPAAGRLVFTNAVHSVAGNISRNASQMTWIYPESYPTQYRVSATSATANAVFMRWKRSADSDFTYADMNGVEWITPPPDPESTDVYTAETAGNIYYVDEKNGNDGNNGKSEAAAFKTIAGAVTNVNASWNAIIYVKPGTYAEGGNTFTVNSKTYGADSRFAVNNAKLLIRSTDGAEATVIVGGSSESPTDADNYPGCGPGAKGIAVLRNSCAIQGFTLTGGHSVDGNSVVSGMVSGKSPVMLDCIVSNNVSMGYATTLNSIRCRFYDNVSSLDVASGVAASCHARGNVVRTNGYGAFRQYAVFCTAVGDVGTGNLSTYCASYNSVWDGCAQISSQWTPYGSVFWNYGSASASGSFVSADPYLASRAGGAEILAASSAIGAGIAPTAENCASFEWYLYCLGDIDGNPICWNGGLPTAGASQSAPVPCVNVAVAANGGLAVSGAPAGVSALDENTTLTITPAEGTRPCIGVAVNGEERPFTNYWPYVISLTLADADERGMLSVAPVYSTDWYVDDDGDDSATGFLPKCAKKTLAAGAACLAAGDTLWALPGTYDEGSNRTANVTVWSRVVVPANTTVKSTDGPEATIIRGADATIERDDYGCGTNAIRCATLVKPNSRLSGFTLTGGRVDRSFGNKFSGMGGGVIGENAQGNNPENGMVVENCIISNCAAAVGSAATYCTVVRSRLLANTVTSYGTAYSSSLYGSLFDGNVGAGVIDHCRDVVECTVTTGNLQRNGSAANAMQNPASGARLANSLFATPLYVTSDSVVGVTNCALLTTSTLTGSNVALDEASCVVTNAEALAMDGDGIPVVGSNAAVDAGSADAYPDEYGFLDGARDLRGFQRVMNGAMDIGCYEGDWSRTYARDLGDARHVTISDVSSNVVEVVATKKVFMPASSALTLTWAADAGTSHPRTLTFVVSSGTLSVSQDGGEATVYAASPAEQSITLSGDATKQFRMAVSADGAATLLACHRHVGMIVVFH